eukprot:c21703_g2_i1 orf=148-348(+)
MVSHKQQNIVLVRLTSLAMQASWRKQKTFVKNLPFQHTTEIWGSLPGAFRVHNYVKLAQHAAECIL